MRMGIGDRAETPVRLDVVYPYRPIVAAAQDVIAGGMHEYASHPILVRFERHETRSIGDRPKADRSIPGSAREVVPRRRL